MQASSLLTLRDLLRSSTHKDLNTPTLEERITGDRIAQSYSKGARVNHG